MGLGSLVGQAIEAARSATESLGLHGDVVVEHWLSQTSRGVPTYADPVSYRALVAEGVQQHLMPDGKAITVRACVTFFPAADGEAPPEISRSDRITLPSGYTGPIVDIPPTFSNPATGKACLRAVWLG